MVQIARGDFNILDFEGPFDEVVIANVSSALIKRDGEIGIIHLPCQHFTQRLAETLGAVYVPFIAGHKKWSKKWDALDVIPMRMADQDVAAQTFNAGGHQVFT